MLYIIGLGLNEKGISKEGLLAIEKSKKVYLESYTVDFPYKIADLHLGKKIVKLKREDVESEKLIKEAKSKKISLLVYGSPLFATTHMSLILDAEKAGVNVKIIYSAGVFDALGETGLQLYKFGKIASMPKQDNSDFLKYVKENQKIKAHSLILVDIGLSYKESLRRLQVKEKIIICSQLGTEKSEIYYGKIDKLKNKDVKAPFCFIVPGELHFLEKEAIERFG